MVEIVTAILTVLAITFIPAMTTAWLKIQAGRADILVLQRDVEALRLVVNSLTAERDSLIATLKEQTSILADQSERLTAAINALDLMTSERNTLSIRIQSLMAENEMLKREIATLNRRIEELEQK